MIRNEKPRNIDRELELQKERLELDLTVATRRDVRELKTAILTLQTQFIFLGKELLKNFANDNKAED